MRKTLASIIILFGMLVASCGGGKDSAESIANKWCDLDKAVNMATTEEAEAVAREARDAYEDEMTEKYGDDNDFMEKIGAAVEACENQR